MDTRLVPLFRRFAPAALVLSLCFFTFPAAQSQQHYEATLDSLNQHPIPQWYADAKLGIFVHWGLYSIPAYAERTDDDFTDFMAALVAGKDTRGRNPYAEFYLNGLRVPGSPTALYHRATFGEDFSYFQFRKQFDRNAAEVDVAGWARFFASVGARYVALVTRH